jgi:predicted TIM-barrel fold metal-dependent hydrolase
MEILDCFCGVGDWATKDPILPGRPDEILGLMDHFGIQKALVYHNMLKFCGWAPEANNQIAEICRKNPRLIPAFIMGLHPHETGMPVGDYLSALKAAGGKAIWLRLPATPYRMARSYASWLIGDWLRTCSEKRIPVFFHAEDDDPTLFHTLCSEFPELRLILTGVSYGADSFLYPLLKQHRQLRVCLGHMYIPSGNPGRFLKHFTADRLLFGSGLPEFSPGGMIAHVQYADIPEADKARILGGNLLELMQEVRL